jgi:hypothetical protein
MINTRNPKVRAKTLALIRYIRAGKDSAEDVDASYYNGQRLKHIMKLWLALCRLNYHDNVTDSEIEVGYLRIVSRYNVNLLVDLCDGKAVLELLAGRLHSHFANNISISTTYITVFSRLLAATLALKFD